jgi:ParB family transcriptional regulator, chromosome partitioning protein
MNTKSNRLGRGLEALIPQAAPGGETEQGGLDSVLITRIRANPRQPRTKFDPAAIAELKQSISENGVIQPITVRRTEGGFELISGERRLRAVTELGFERVPAYVIDVDSDEKMLEMALVENIQREDLNPIELARAYELLQTQYHLGQEEVARKVGKDRATVANFLRLLKLPEAIQDSVSGGGISMGHARAIMGLSSRSDQMAVWKRATSRGWSVRKVEEEVRRIAEPAEKKQKGRTEKKHSFFTEAEDRIRTVLGTQIRIQPSGKGGRIEIQYYSQDDLDRIIELIEELQE